MSQAMGLGDRLQSLLLYQFVPGAYGADVLGDTPGLQLQTILGQRLQQAYNLQFNGVPGQVQALACVCACCTHSKG